MTNFENESGRTLFSRNGVRQQSAWLSAPVLAGRRKTSHRDGLTHLRVEPFESVLVLVALVLAMSTFNGILLDTDGERGASSTLFAPIVSAIYGTALFLMGYRMPTEVSTLLRRSWPLLLLTAFACASALWSPIPAATARRGLALALTTSFAFYVSIRFTPNEFFKLLYVAFALYIGVAFLSALVVPNLAIYSGGLFSGAWRGLTGMKNEFGRTLGLMIVMFGLLRAYGSIQWYRFSLLGLGASTLLLFLSTSRTPQLAAIATFPAVLVLYVLAGGSFGRNHYRLSGSLGIIGGTIIAAIAAVGIFVVAPIVLEALGRDLTLSGRTKLWAWVAEIAMERPWFGSGYRSFWVDENTKYFFEYFAWLQSADGELSDSYNGPNQSHSSYMDVFGELGFVGIALFLLLMMSTFARLFRAIRGNDILAVPFSAVTVFMLVEGVAEKVFLQQTADVWLVFMVFYFYSSANSSTMPAPARRFDDLYAVQYASRT